MALAAGLVALSACRAVDPGPNFVIAEEQFNEDYFYCRVEPLLIFGKKCGSGEPGDGGNCHFNASAVSGMALVNHDPIDCAGGDHPVDRTRIGAGSPAQGNLQAASLEMNRDYLTAPLFVRPTSNRDHPREVFKREDPVVDVIRTWAERP
ncbi:hypothetical protein [Pendulispora albinea]|uniref:Rieske domain-containing protein n=1 Tax=Pendulispora albinea TaxID=2741071 RepID=A0ABZ2MAZ2_9BACT